MLFCFPAPKKKVCDECLYFSGVLTSLLGASNDDNLHVLVMVKTDMKKKPEKGCFFFFFFAWKTLLIGILIPETMEAPQNHPNDIPKTGPQRCGNLTPDGPYEVLGCYCFLACFYSSLILPFSCL